VILSANLGVSLKAPKRVFSYRLITFPGRIHSRQQYLQTLFEKDEQLHSFGRSPILLTSSGIDRLLRVAERSLKKLQLKIAGYGAQKFVIKIFIENQ